MFIILLYIYIYCIPLHYILLYYIKCKLCDIYIYTLYTSFIEICSIIQYIHILDCHVFLCIIHINVFVYTGLISCIYTYTYIYMYKDR